MAWYETLIRANKDVNTNECAYQDKIEAQDDNHYNDPNDYNNYNYYNDYNYYLEAGEGMSCEEESQGVSDASWCLSLECWLEMSPGQI